MSSESNEIGTIQSSMDSFIIQKATPPATPPKSQEKKQESSPLPVMIEILKPKPKDTSMEQGTV